jgi:hypothetical protein
LNAEKYRALSDAILLGIVSCSIWLHRVGFASPRLGEPFDTLVVALASVVSYELMLRSLLLIAKNSETFLRVYWAGNYLSGLWYYTSQDDRGGNNLGLWRIQQDFFSTSINGFRVNERFEKVTTVGSVSDLLQIGGKFEIINRRTDWDFSRQEYFSKSILQFDTPTRSGIFRYPLNMRGETIIYGGEINGLVSNNVIWTKLINIDTEEQALDFLKNNFFYDRYQQRWMHK